MMDGGGETTATATMEGRGLKKGPWTTTEDAILTEYVRKHGEGNWNAVQKNSEKIIIELHAKLGNKWARMASQLPGRTDNEIKNYWNTRMKRRQRAGLPLYPHEIQHQGIDNDDEFEFDLTSFQFQNQDLDHNHQNMIQYTNSSNTSSSSSSFSSSSSQPSKRLRPDPLVTTNPGLNLIPDSSMDFHMFSLYNNSLENDNNQFGFSVPLSSSSSSNDPNHILEFISENSDTNNTNKKDIDAMSYSSLLMGDLEIRPSSFPLGLENSVLELPSNQTPTHSFSSNLDNGVHLEPLAGNSGLLDALLEESQALSRGGLFKDVRVSSSDLCEVQDKRVKMDFENRLIDHLNSSHHSSLGTNPNIHNKYNEPTLMVKTTVDDDDDLLMSLLNNFPSATTPLPDWYRMTEIQNEASYLAPPSGSIIMGNHQGNGRVEPPTVPPSSSVDPMASLGSCYWSNMPSIC
ncbi:unnamed protein product [Arabidopsis arenosa]|uniref:Uncharacterized protein n=1 Tax=Arabidopsis arenosa TaxID=38785 RepID=A0A8S2A5G5_ARAAE|nr:unnamed protein product [Arabidopsis arenosa]